MGTTTSTTGSAPTTITAEQLIAQMRDVLDKLGPPIPEIRVSSVVPYGQYIEFPSGSPLLPNQHPNGMIFVSPADYKEIFGDDK